jgi:hypothetical protein
MFQTVQIDRQLVLTLGLVVSLIIMPSVKALAQPATLEGSVSTQDGTIVRGVWVWLTRPNDHPHHKSDECRDKDIKCEEMSSNDTFRWTVPAPNRFDLIACTSNIGYKPQLLRNVAVEPGEQKHVRASLIPADPEVSMSLPLPFDVKPGSPPAVRGRSIVHIIHKETNCEVAAIVTDCDGTFKFRGNLGAEYELAGNADIVYTLKEIARLLNRPNRVGEKDCALSPVR